MTEILTESFCERCGTRYTFETPARRSLPLGKLDTVGRGLRNFLVKGEGTLDEAFASARAESEQRAATQQLEAFHQTFNFCLSCRQYTCAECWNTVEGRCLSCEPLRRPEPEARADMAVAAEAMPISTFEAATLPAPAGATWPTVDGHHHDVSIEALAVAAPVEIEPEPVEAELPGVEPVEPEPVEPEPVEPEPVEPEPEPEFVEPEPPEAALAEPEVEEPELAHPEPAEPAAAAAEAVVAEPDLDGIEPAGPEVVEPELELDLVDPQIVEPEVVEPELELAEPDLAEPVAGATIEPERVSAEPAPLFESAEPDRSKLSPALREFPPGASLDDEIAAYDLRIAAIASPAPPPPDHIAATARPAASTPAQIAAAQAVVPDLPAPSDEATPAGRNTGSCPSCGLSLSASARFCRRCGTPQQAA